jgi:deoxyribonuclease V
MSAPVQHRWDLSPAEAQAVQQELRRRVVADDDFGPIRFVAGVDNSYVPDTATTCAGVVVLSWPELAVVERQVSRTPTTFPYVPGLLSFREAPGVLAAIALLRTEPDLFIFDGQGIAHMRRLGLARHVHRHSRGPGKRTTTVVPWPTALSTVICPPCCSTIILDPDRPMPVPAMPRAVEAR